MKDLILNNKRSDLDCIAAPVKVCMARFESDFAAALGVSEMPMQVIVDFLLDTPGKRFRPLLVFLVASLCGEVNGQTRRVASFVEMLHTATLLHDDVVDGDLERRGKPSVNARWDNLSAVLAGDYLLARALLLLSDPQDAAILSEMLQTSLTMSVGELVQHQRRKECLAKEPVGVPSRENIVSESLPEEAYLDIITHKTARLIRSCCVAAALSVGAPQKLVEGLGRFGLLLGQVFQMRDDVLDADDPQTAACAEKLLPQYQSLAMEALDSLSPMAQHPEYLASLRSLTTFCATRSL